MDYYRKKEIRMGAFSNHITQKEKLAPLLPLKSQSDNASNMVFVPENRIYTICSRKALR